MNKNLKTLQVIAKIGKILSKIVWICCIVGAIGCLVGIASLAAGVNEIAKIGDLTIHGVIENESGMSLGTLYASMTVGMILCIGEIVLAKFAERYFTNELKAGTPFTESGAKEMMRLGILTICIPIGTTIVVEIAHAVLNHYFANVAELHMDDVASVGLGVAFIIFSLVFRYGAELLSKSEEEI